MSFVAVMRRITTRIVNPSSRLRACGNEGAKGKDASKEGWQLESRQQTFFRADSCEGPIWKTSCVEWPSRFRRIEQARTVGRIEKAASTSRPRNGFRHPASATNAVLPDTLIDMANLCKALVGK